MLAVKERPFVEQRGPFTVTEREVRHDRFGMQLIADKTVKDGKEGEQFWINFPNEPVQIFALDEENNIYLGNEFTYAANKRKLEGAGGSPQKGESFEAAAIREIREELGLEVDRLQKLPTYESITSRVNNPTHTYLARVKSVGKATPDASEDIKLEKMPLPRALELVKNGVINTGVVAAAIWHINEIVSQEQKPPTFTERIKNKYTKFKNGIKRFFGISNPKTHR